jgi:hypothetical protein
MSLNYTTYLFREVRKITYDDPSFPGVKMYRWEITGNDRVADHMPDWRDRDSQIHFYDVFTQFAREQFGMASEGYELFPLESKVSPDRNIVPLQR